MGSGCGDSLGQATRHQLRESRSNQTGLPAGGRSRYRLAALGLRRGRIRSETDTARNATDRATRVDTVPITRKSNDRSGASIDSRSVKAHVPNAQIAKATSRSIPV